MDTTHDSQTINVLMVGTGEYTTGYVHGRASQSDKGAGVVALTLFDLRRQGKVGELLMAGTNGSKFPGIRQHLLEAIENRYRGLNTQMQTFPADNVEKDPTAYQSALDQLSPGDAVIIFTPDDTHFQIAMEAIQRECHILIAKPLCKTLDEHRRIIAAAQQKDVIAAMEVHKRWDPIYADARDRIRALGHFSHFSSYMSQPKSQLETFRHWAGKASDISYYLNAHHIDFNAWAVGNTYLPTIVSATASFGLARSMDIPTEDSITLSTQWENSEGYQAHALYTASWVAPKSDVHSQQRFHYMGTEGEVTVDQAHRGYALSTDREGFQSPNPLFMKYAPNERGEFVGQDAYGYRSIQTFVEAAISVKQDRSCPADWHGQLATAQDTLAVTAILEAGRTSLDQGNRPVRIDLHPDAPQNRARL